MLEKNFKIYLKKLELIHCFKNNRDASLLLKGIKSNRELEELRLSSVNFNHEMISNLGEFVTNNFCLKSLNLSWSEISGDEMVRLLNKIKNIKHLQHLDISTIPFEGSNSVKLIELMKEHIVKNNSLIHLNMSSCNLGSKEIKELWEGIKKSKSLLSVHLSGNIGKETIKNIMKESKIDKEKSIKHVLSPIKRNKEFSYHSSKPEF